MIDDDVLDRLRSEAAKAPHPDGHASHHAAVILDKSFNPICYGHNRYGRHAEFHAITKMLATPKFRGAKPAAILVVRVNKTGKFVGSEPCLKCRKLIKETGLQAFHT